MARRKIGSGVVVAVSATLMAAFVGGYLWQLGDARQAALSETAQGQARIGGPFSLIDQNGARRTDADFRGRYMLVFFGFTYCPDVCPTTLAVLSAALEEMGPLADEVAPLLITVDPERDTPEMLKPYLSAFDSRFVGLTGTKPEIDEVVDAYSAYYEIVRNDDENDYTVVHSTAIYLMDPEGRFLKTYDIDMGPEAIASDIEAVMLEADGR